MNLEELLKLAFFGGRMFICHRTTCHNEEMYTVETDDGMILFIVTKDWFDTVHEKHPSEAIQTLECGCVVRSIIPNEVAEGMTGFSLN